MGVDARITVYAASERQAQEACAAAFERLAALDTMMSDYRKDSELMRLCDMAGTGPVHVSPELFVVLQRSQEFSAVSGGNFDVTVGPIVQLWRKARRTKELPKKAELNAARSLVGWKKMSLNKVNQTVTLALPGMRLDLGAIAKGYADDEAQKVLKHYGVKRALVEMGGDTVVSEPPPGTKGWRVRIPSPRGGAGFEDLFLKNCGISTSGDEMQFVEIGGIRYSHVINPHTGWALKNSVEATVTAKDGLTSDPLSTTLTLLSAKTRKRLLKAYPGSHVYVRHMPR